LLGFYAVFKEKHMFTPTTAKAPMTNHYLQVTKFRQKFVDRQKDMTIAVLLSRAFTEMRFRCRHDYRGTDIPMMSARLELTDTVNQMVYDLSINDEGTWVHTYKVFAFWDRRQSADVFMRVFELGANGDIKQEALIDMAVTNMATLDPVWIHNRLVKGPRHAISAIREAFIDVGAFVEPQYWSIPDAR
jgi:hypothetical protein